MLYYSMQVIWPRESALLFVPADKPVIRGIYANLTTLATWGEFFSILFGWFLALVPEN